jgi:hypothetical protein
MGSHTWALRFLGISEIYYGLILNGPIFQHLLGGSMTVGGETLARQRLARDAGWVRFGCENWEYVGRKDKFGGGLQKNLQVERIYGAYFDTFFA